MKKNGIVKSLFLIVLFGLIRVSMSAAIITPQGYNDHDFQALVKFAEQGTNMKKLGWDFSKFPREQLFRTTWVKVGDEMRLENLTLRHVNSMYDEPISGIADFSNCSSLKLFYCTSSDLVSINLSGCPILETIQLNSIKIEELNFSGFTSLKSVEISSMQTKKIDLSNCVALTSIYCMYNSPHLQSLNIKGCSNILQINCYNSQLTELDVAQAPLLKYLYCEKNKFTELDISTNANLETLNCADNRLTSINISKNNKLNYISCNDNPITSLDISNVSPDLICNVRPENTNLVVHMSNNRVIAFSTDNNGVVELNHNKTTQEIKFTAFPKDKYRLKNWNVVGVERSELRSYENKNITGIGYKSGMNLDIKAEFEALPENDPVITGSYPRGSLIETINYSLRTLPDGTQKEFWNNVPCVYSYDIKVTSPIKVRNVFYVKSTERYSTFLNVTHCPFELMEENKAGFLRVWESEPVIVSSNQTIKGSWDLISNIDGLKGRGLYDFAYFAVEDAETGRILKTDITNYVSYSKYFPNLLLGPSSEFTANQEAVSFSTSFFLNHTGSVSLLLMHTGCCFDSMPIEVYNKGVDSMVDWLDRICGSGSSTGIKEMQAYKKFGRIEVKEGESKYVKLDWNDIMRLDGVTPFLPKGNNEYTAFLIIEGEDPEPTLGVGLKNGSALRLIHSYDVPMPKKYTGIENVQSNELRIYSDLERSLLKIQNPENILGNCKMYNISGVMVKSFHVKGEAVESDISSLGKGIYIVRVEDETGRVLRVRKIVR